MTFHVYRIDVHAVEPPPEYEMIDGSLFYTVDAAVAAVRETYRAVYARIPPDAGCTVGPTNEREFFGREVRFPEVHIIKEIVSE